MPFGGLIYGQKLIIDALSTCHMKNKKWSPWQFATLLHPTYVGARLSYKGTGSEGWELHPPTSALTGGALF